MSSVLVIFGTRPEAIKLCPVVLRLQSRRDQFHVKVCVTGQHSSMLEQVLEAFRCPPDYDLAQMILDQSLLQSTSRILSALEPIIRQECPDIVLVQGDTTTTLCGALAAFYQRIPVGHVEAGLRTGDVFQPFPEEMNRVLTTRLATLHFAATQGAADNLAREGVDRRMIAVTGNPGIDAVLHIRARLEDGRLSSVVSRGLDPSKKLIVVTAHRRESFGNGLQSICRALLRLAQREDVQIVYPVHANPNVQNPVHRYLAGQERIQLLDPLGYVAFVDLMRRAYLLLTDSGGIQEEGLSLGKPILVMREKTERPEGVTAGNARLVGTDEDRIVTQVNALLDDPESHRGVTRDHNPYGDGHASQRIADVIDSFVKEKRGNAER